MKIGIFPSAGLGDGIIQLILAQNLARLELCVDYFHHFIVDLNDYVGLINVYDPHEKDLEKLLTMYDVILIDSGAKGIDLSKFYNKFRDKIATYTLGQINPYSIRKKQRLFNPYFNAPKLLINNHQVEFDRFNGKSLRAPPYLGLSVADQIVHFLKSNLLVKSAFVELDFSWPQHWVKQKNINKILIHPCSSSENKNWLAQRYIELARNLKQQGYMPVFTVSPDERNDWVKLIGNQFPMPCFESLDCLARYYYESGMLIGNDSGNGHLASAVGLPTITIVNRRSRNFAWRPKWSRNKVIKPLISRKLVGNYYWKHTISIKRVLNTFKSFEQQ